MMIEGGMPVEKIIATCQIDFGCKVEAEIVVLGVEREYKAITNSADTMRDLGRKRCIEIFIKWRV